eukprot:12516976-Alexandrium_andersonii.AAC.1
MSASLVGSEMCIRDSLKRHSAAAAAAACRRPATPHAWTSWAAAMVGLEPVSYTHLTLPTICSV